MKVSLTTSRGLVTLVNPNFVKPGVTPIALDILTTHLEGAGFEVEVLDLTFRGTDWGLSEYFATRDPLLVGVTLRNAGSVQPQVQQVFLPDHLAVVDAIRREEDNNYADNPFLMQAVALGYKGAYYSWWRDRDRITTEASLAGVSG